MTHILRITIFLIVQFGDIIDIWQNKTLKDFVLIKLNEGQIWSWFTYWTSNKSLYSYYSIIVLVLIWIVFWKKYTLWEYEIEAATNQTMKINTMTDSVLICQY